MKKAVMGIVAVIIAIILWAFLPKEESIGQEKSIFEPIPFEERIKHDEGKKFEEWATNYTPSYLIKVTSEDIDLMARVVMSEASLLEQDGKQLVASTIVYRVMDGRRGKTVSEVVNYPNAYSTQDNGTPNEDCYRAVYSALIYDAFPHDLFYFRSGKPHSFGFVYAQVGNTYFTTEGEVK